MFYYKLLVTFTIITVGLCSLNDEPERCCVAKQFSSKISVSIGMALPDGTVYTSYAYYNYSFDANRTLAGLKGISIDIDDGEKTRLWIIQNITDGQMYVFNLDTRVCDKSKMPFKPLQCIPETATFIDSSVYGYGDKMIIGDTWLVVVNETTSFSTVSRGDCVPLTGNVFTAEPHMISALTTTNFVPRIDDPSVFDIPSECRHLF